MLIVCCSRRRQNRNRNHSTSGNGSINRTLCFGDCICICIGSVGGVYFLFDFQDDR